jgi:hypothetical protein
MGCICLTEIHKSLPFLLQTMQMPPVKTPSPYVRRHDRINFVKTESSSLLAVHASPRVDNHEEALPLQQVANADCHCSLALGPVMTVELDFVEEIMMSAGCQGERVRWRESE